MQLWLTDPKTKEASVSLTMLIITFVGSLIAATLHMLGKVDDTSIMTDLFYANTALYFGRRFSIKNKDYNSEKTEGSKE